MTDLNQQQFGKVAVLYGGHSGEREVSLRSGQAVFDALIKESVDAHLIDTQSSSIAQIAEANFDHAFIMLHGQGGEDGVIQGALESIGLPYTGSGVLGSALAMDKRRSKLVWQAAGLPIIDAQYVAHEQQVSDTEAKQMLYKLGGKVMVKPAQEGSSLGMNIANSEQQLQDAIKDAQQYAGDVVIERYITGSEYTMSILGGVCLPSIRIQPAREFYDYTAKYTESGTEYFCPSGVSDEQEQSMQTIAMQAFELLGCSGWGRVDFIYDEATSQMLLLEANTVPGMTTSSLVPMAAKQAGLSFEDLVIAILATATEQARGDQQ